VTKIICFVGLPGSGKTVATGVGVQLGIPIVKMGDILREEVAERGLPEEMVGEVASDIRREEGMDVIARRCIPKIKDIINGGGEVIIIDGIRCMEEVERFRDAFGGSFELIKIESNDESRYERMKIRGRVDDEGFRGRDEREIGWGMKTAMELADVTIVNDGSIKKFEEEVHMTLVEDA
jgi:dephospho-CoA kinase